MGDILEGKERKLEGLTIDREIAGKETDIAREKAIAREMKKKYGSDWKHILGIVGKSIRPNREAIQDLFAINPELRDLHKTRGSRIR